MNILSSLACACAIIIAVTSAKADETFTLIQDKPEVVDIDLGDAGASHGDMFAFTGVFTAEDGKKGVVRGINLSMNTTDGSGAPHFSRFANIVLDFGGNDTLVVGGHAAYVVGSIEMVVDAPQVRAITGGTGRFIGASGQVTTTRREAGHYEHKIELVD